MLVPVIWGDCQPCEIRTSSVYTAPQHSQAGPAGYPVYGGAPMGYGHIAQPQHPQPGQDPFGF